MVCMGRELPEDPSACEEGSAEFHRLRQAARPRSEHKSGTHLHGPQDYCTIHRDPEKSEDEWISSPMGLLDLRGKRNAL